MPAFRVLVIELRRVLVLTLVCAVASPAAAFADGFVARRYDVRLTILSDGSVDVIETIRLAAGDTPMTSFRRTLPADHTDGLQLAGVRLDGNPLTTERDGLGLGVRGRRNLDLTITFSPTVRADRVIEIRYRAQHVVAMDDGRPRLRWAALPARHDYVIDRAAISVSAPAGAEAREVRASGGVVGSGADGGLQVTATPVARNATVDVDIVFVPGTLVPTDPIWFRDQERAGHLVPAFVSSFLVLLVIALGVLAMVFAHDRVRRSAQDRRWRLAAAAGPGRPMAEPEPLDPTLPPGLASLLVANGRAREWRSLQAAFVGLLQRGVLRIASSKAGAERPGAFRVHAGSGAAAWSHEQWLVDQAAAHGDGVSVRRFMRAMFRRQRAFHRCLAADARTLGWMEVERGRTANGLRVTGLGLVVFAFASAALVAWRFDHLGPAAQMVPAGLFVDGLLFVVASAIMGRLSERGERLAVAWCARAAAMRGTARRPIGAAEDPADAATAAQWLAFAVGIGAAGTHAALRAVIGASGASHGGSNGVSAGGGTGDGGSRAV